MKLTSSAGVRMSGIPLLHAFVTRIGPSLQLSFWLLSVTYFSHYNLPGIYGILSACFHTFYFLAPENHVASFREFTQPCLNAVGLSLVYTDISCAVRDE